MSRLLRRRRLPDQEEPAPRPGAYKNVRGILFAVPLHRETRSDEAHGWAVDVTGLWTCRIQATGSGEHLLANSLRAREVWPAGPEDASDQPVRNDG